MPATASIRELNSEESEDTRGDYFTGRQWRSDRQHGAPSYSAFGGFQWFLPAINLTVAQLDGGRLQWRYCTLQPLNDFGATT